ncbi:MAG: PilZ domain-containing protein [Gammaproteobacteria bacterium]|nr:MAG: PilZ domain-containing protein [Gammaproteobacteria bacterium]
MSYYKGYSEKRDFFRMMVRATVEFQVEGDSRVYTGVTEDLSATGIMFATDCHLKPGQKIVLKVLPDNNQQTPLKADVEIIRVDVNDKKEFVAAGNMSNVE